MSTLGGRLTRGGMGLTAQPNPFEPEQEEGLTTPPVLAAAQVVQGTHVAGTRPTDGQVMRYDATAEQYTHQDLPTPVGAAPDTAQYVVMALSAGLTSERRLQVALPLVLTDGGANGDADIDHAAQTANTMFAGPTGGGAADPAFRVMHIDDLVPHKTSHASAGADKLYGAHQYVFLPDAALGADIAVDADAQGIVHPTSPATEKAQALHWLCDVAPGTSCTIIVEYSTNLDYDSPGSWTTIATKAFTGKGDIQTTMTTTDIPADRLIRMRVSAVSGTAPQDCRGITLEVLRPLRTV